MSNQLPFFTCPKCNTTMMIFSENGKYVSHGCKKCKEFFELENIEEFQ